MASPKQQVRMGPAGDELPTDSNQPPWPEWSDTVLNNMQWTGTSKPHKKSVSSSVPASSRRSRAYSIIFDPSEELFEDPAGLVNLPEDMLVDSWKRPFQLDATANFVLKPDVTPFRPLDHNKHLVNHKIMETIISSVLCLEHEAMLRPFPIEHQSQQFVATDEPLWKPWHHVYAFTLAGKNKTHTIQYNRFGKYVVRLFYLGKWRRLLVDDRLPLDQEGNLLLPVSSPDNLWLPILSKALLRVAALSWVPGNDTVDFSVVHCLTGWVPTIVPCKSSSLYQLWEVCCNLMRSTEEILHSPGRCSNLEEPSRCPQDDSVEGLPAVCSRVIFGVILSSPIKRTPQNMQMSLTNVEQMVLISNASYNSERPDPMWKEYRWKEWAFQKGIISDISSQPVRNVQIYNPLEIPSITLPFSSVDHSYIDGCWLDFDIFITLTRHLEVYYKPSYFKYGLKAWSLLGLLDKPNVLDDVVFQRGRKISPKKLEKRKSKSRSKSKSPEPKDTTSTAASTTRNKKSSKGSQKTKSDKGKSPKERSRYASVVEWPTNNVNPPLFYFFIDSMVCKQVYFCLSAYNPDGHTYAHVLVGTLTWHSPAVVPIVFMLSTSATKSHMVTLSPGLHVFRIWHQFPVHFCFQIYSNTMFATGMKMKMQNFLTFDSSSYEFYGKEISSSFEKLLDTSQGGAEHGKSYDYLMNCLCPLYLKSQLTWPHWFTATTDLQQAFEESLTEMLVEFLQLPEEVYQALQAFQMLFLNPAFGEKALENIRIDVLDYIEGRRESLRLRQLLLEEEIRDKVGARKRRSKSKSSRSSKSKKSPDKGSKKKAKSSAETGKTGKQKGNKKDKGKAKKLGEQMRKLLMCKEKNLLITDPNNAILLLKKMMVKVPHLRKLYPFGGEDDCRLVFQDFIGELRTGEKWVVLVRCVLNIHSTEDVPCSVHIWSPLEKIVLGLINNDTKQLVPLGFVENRTANLSRNNEGYTLYVYGESQSEVVNWRLRSIGVREGDLLHVCHGMDCHNSSTQLPQQAQHTLHGFYIPNKHRLITRCLLEVYTDMALLLRLHMSCSTALCSFAILDESGNYVENLTGMGHITLPVFKVKGKEGPLRSSWRKSAMFGLEANVYYIEVRLLDNTWPLSLDQRRAMLYYKEHLPAILLGPASELDSTSASTSSFSVTSTNDDAEFAFFEKTKKPSWSITMACDLSMEMAVKLSLDTSVFDRLQLFKLHPQPPDLDPVKCKNLRQDILKKMAEEEEDFSEEAMFHLEAKKTKELTRLYSRKIEYPSWPEPRYEDTSDLSMSMEVPEVKKSSVPKTNYSAPVIESLASIVRDSPSQMSRVPSLIKATFGGEGSESNTNVLAQQAAIHKAFQKMKTKTLERTQEIFEETAALRRQVCSELLAAKEAESKKAKTKVDSPKGKKSRDKDKASRKKSKERTKSKRVKGK